jgi:2-keto-4-pentenoate hydratase/2-oxohepta-3-ene-1,7-dioic acid hydratase in catechol pathway
MTRIARAEISGTTWLCRLDDGGTLHPLVQDSPLPGLDPLRLLLDQGRDPATMTAAGEPTPLDQARLRSPLSAPQKILAIGLNYADHARESNIEPPSAPVLFVKTPNSLLDPDADIVVATGTTEQLDWEVELAAVIGIPARNVSEEDALNYVLGYTICDDISARDAQFADGQWVRGKSYDGFCPLGPWIVTRDEISDPQSLGIRCRVNGETMQDATTKEMIFSVSYLISYLSRFMTLEPGDVIATGTPFGVGFARTPAVYLQDGDVVECEVDGIGVLRNTVRFRGGHG